MWALAPWLALCILAILYNIVDYSRNWKKWQKILKLPGFKPRTLLGNLLTYGVLKGTERRRLLAVYFQIRSGLTHLFHKEGLYHFWIARVPILVLTRAHTVEAVLNSQALIEKSALYTLAADWVGAGLIVSSGDMWRRDRKKLTPAFHFRILDDFLGIMNEQSAIMTENLLRTCRGKEFMDPQELMSLCVLDITLETSLGLKLEAQRQTSTYVKLVEKILHLISKRAMTPWLYPNYYFLTSEGRDYLQSITKMNKMTDEIIENKMIEKQKSKEKIQDQDLDDPNVKPQRKMFLDLLVEANLSKREMRDQANTFIAAGFHTVASSLSWLIYLLGLHQDVQDKLYEEVERVFDGKRIEEVTQENLKDLKYMDCVIKECHRLFPAVPAVFRYLTEDVKIGKYEIPKGVECVIAMYHVHRDPDIYPEPEVFDPDRFLPENSVGRSPFALIPFSAGPRSCIGQRYALMEMKVIVAHLISRVCMRSLDPRDKVVLTPEVTLRPVEELRIQFTPRNSSFNLNRNGLVSNVPVNN